MVCAFESLSGPDLANILHFCLTSGTPVIPLSSVTKQMRMIDSWGLLQCWSEAELLCMCSPLLGSEIPSLPNEVLIIAAAVIRDDSCTGELKQEKK